jgi:hypothetical protein
MKAEAPRMAGGWFSGKIILAYGLGAFLLLGSAGALKLLPTQSLSDAIFALAPRPGGQATAEVDREKTREALAKLPPILAKLGFALLGVAVLAWGVRSIEPATVGDGPPVHEPQDAGQRSPFRGFDWVVPLTLSIVVLAQVAPSMGRPLAGDELENYQLHLKLPLKGTLTTMSGANNQLGFSVLAWASIRVFGDSPASVRLPALLGVMLLPVVAYRFGLKEFGRSGATVLGLLLALWPDSIMAGMQGRSYSLLMLFSIVHLYYFKRFATTHDRRSGWAYAATLGVACTLHMWFVLVAGSELLFLGLLKLADWIGWESIRIRTPLRIETFLLFMTLGGLGAAVVQAGILPKFLFILTQKSPVAIDARVVLNCMAESLHGTSLVSEAIPLSYQNSWITTALRTGVDLVALVGLLACVRGAWKNQNARFLVGFGVVVASTFFLVITIQKPVYLYARFFLVVPMILAFAAARGWSFLLEPRLGLSPVATRTSASTIAA